MNKRPRLDRQSIIDVLNNDTIGAVLTMAPWRGLNALIRTCRTFADAAVVHRREIEIAQALTMITVDGDYVRRRRQLPNATPVGFTDIMWTTDDVQFMVRVKYRNGVPDTWDITKNDSNIASSKWGSDRSYAMWKESHVVITEYQVCDNDHVGPVAETVIYFAPGDGPHAMVRTAAALTRVTAPYPAAQHSYLSWYEMFILPSLDDAADASNLALRTLLPNYDYVVGRITTLGIRDYA